MRIAVTGGSGFIGSRVVGRLEQEGHNVVVLDLHANPNGNHRTCLVDITNLPALKETLRDVDVVYHLAGPVLESFRRNPYASHYLQEVGTLNVLEAARQNGVRKVILASSFYVYDGIDEKMIVNEKTTLDIKRMELFGAAKLMSEELVKRYAVKYELEYVILRFGSAYGWGECSNVIKTFIETGLRGGPMEVWGRGSRRNQYTYVGDIAEGCALALNEVNETYNLISPEDTATGEIAYLLRDVFRVEIVFNELRQEGASMPYMSSRKAMKRLGWNPIRVQEGIMLMKQQIPALLSHDESMKLADLQRS